MSKCNAILKKNNTIWIIMAVFYDYCHLKCYLYLFLVINEQIFPPILNDNFYILNLKVKPHGEIYIDQKILWKECASSHRLPKKGAKERLPDVWTWIPGFTLHKLADMRRTGVGKPRPLLDQEKLDLFRGKTIQGTGYCILKVSHFRPVHTAKWDHVSWYIFEQYFLSNVFIYEKR